MFQKVPLGPDESPHIQALQERVKLLEDAAAKLDGKIVARPVPGQYHVMVAEVQRFVGSMGALERVLGLVHRLQVSSCRLQTALLPTIFICLSSICGAYCTALERLIKMPGSPEFLHCLQCRFCSFTFSRYTLLPGQLASYHGRHLSCT